MSIKFTKGALLPLYQALYRKWRPLSFKDVSGQLHITETLRRQIDASRLSHAYLFTGTRGTGKTTCAKILSRAVNCLHPNSGDPCNKCPSCLGILDGSILDVIEIDAASNSGVDNIRALREETVYSPVAVKYRVYIIDEVHMLSTGAFNALLKTLEEPPAHVLFILATTETHKVPATIVSRCQRFAFKRIAADDIAARLMTVAKEENIPLTTQAANLIARLSDGALRDALSLLDQCAGAHFGVSIGVNEITEALGLADSETVVKWALMTAQRDTPGAIRLFDNFIRSGRDVSSVLDELCVLLRDVLMFHLLGECPESSRFSAVSLTSIMKILPVTRLIEMLRLIQEAQARIPKGINKRFEVELCLVKLCRLGTSEALYTEPGLVIQPDASLPISEELGVSNAMAATGPVKETAVLESENLSNAATDPTPPVCPVNEPQPNKQLTIWQTVLQKSPPFYKPFLDSSKIDEGDGKITIFVSDEFAEKLLKDAGFQAFLSPYYPKGIEVLIDIPKVDTKKRLGELSAKGGNLVSILGELPK